MSHHAASVAAAAASTLNALSKSKSHSGAVIDFLQQATAQSALVQLLTGHGTAAHAALQLLLTLVGQSVDVHFQTPITTGINIQQAMSQPGILNGLVYHLAQGQESTAVAAVVLLARWTASKSSADNPCPWLKGSQLADLFDKNRMALNCVCSLLLHRGSKVCLADAAVQLLHTIAQAGPQAAGMLASTQVVMSRLAGLMMTSSKQPPAATPDVKAKTTAAAWRAARALSNIFKQVDARVRWQLVTNTGVIVQLVQALKQAEDAALQDRDIQVLLAAVTDCWLQSLTDGNQGPSVCEYVIAQPAFAASLLRLLPGGTRPVQVAQKLASALVASSTIGDCARLLKDFVATLVDTMRQADSSASLQNPTTAAAAAAAAEQAVWVLTKLPSARTDICQLLEPVVPLLVSAPICGVAEGNFRNSLASRLAVLAAQPTIQESGGAPAWPHAAGIALELLIDGASTEARTSLAAADGVISNLAKCCETTSHGVCDSAGRALTQLAAVSKMQLTPTTAATAPDGGESSMHTWLVANSSTLQQLATSGWGCLSLTQLAAAAKMATQRNPEPQQPGSAPVPAPVPPPCAPPPPPPPPSSSQPRSIPPPPPAAAARLQQPRKAAAAAAHKPTTDTSRCRTDQGGATAAAARMLAGQAATCSQPKSSAAFNALDPATQKQIQEECGGMPPDQQLPAWKVAVQPFDSQQLQALCATYMRCNFAGVSWGSEVRSQELVPLLQQLHTQAKAEQLAAPTATPGAAAAAKVQPTPATVKLLCALRMLQHWDIVCPTQPGMPQPLRKLMQQAGCAADGGGDGVDDGDDDVQVVESGPAAEVDDDVDAQLQQLEDGECELVLVKYVPGRHEQPDVQLLDQQPPKAAQPAMQQQDPAVPLVLLPGQQQQQKQGGDVRMQPVLEEELPLQMRTRAAKRRRDSVLP